MVCVKFVQSYSKDVHYMFARIGCAPKFRGFEILVGGWKMVVMDFISGNGYTLLFGSHVRREIVVDLLENKSRSVHDAGFVHRDVRSANIMVKTNSDDDLAPILLDFDWSGKIGEVRYPMNVYNGKSLWRPASAVDSKPILPEHDIDILHRLLPIRPETPVTSLAHIHPSGSGDDLMLQLPAISQRASPGNLKHAMEDDVNGMALDCPATCLNGHTVDGQSDTDFAQRCIRLAAHCISFANVSLRSESFSPLY